MLKTDGRNWWVWSVAHWRKKILLGVYYLKRKKFLKLELEEPSLAVAAYRLFAEYGHF